MPDKKEDKNMSYVKTLIEDRTEPGEIGRRRVRIEGAKETGAPLDTMVMKRKRCDTVLFGRIEDGYVFRAIYEVAPGGYNCDVFECDDVIPPEYGFAMYPPITFGGETDAPDTERLDENPPYAWQGGMTAQKIVIEGQEALAFGFMSDDEKRLYIRYVIIPHESYVDVCTGYNGALDMDRIDWEAYRMNENTGDRMDDRDELFEEELFTW